jgi:hypothetical protein
LAGAVGPVPDFRALVLHVAELRGLASPQSNEPDPAELEYRRVSAGALDERLAQLISAARTGVKRCKRDAFLVRFTGALARDDCARLVRMSVECWDQDPARRLWAVVEGKLAAMLDQYLPAPAGRPAAPNTRAAAAGHRSQGASSAATSAAPTGRV